MKRIKGVAGALLLVLGIGGSPSISAEPPFGGTVFLDPDIILDTDPTTFKSIAYAGTGPRTMFDRRVANWIEIEPYLFDVEFTDGLYTEFQVNPEFGSVEAAQEQAEYYAKAIGRLPYSLRRHAETSWIHMGDEAFGGGNNNILIHTGQTAQDYIETGVLEEVLVHEAVHTSLDAMVYADPAWQQAQQDDPEFISTYARDFPDREDAAESFLPWLAVRYRSDRISQELKDTIEQTMPARIAYFDKLNPDMALVGASEFHFNVGLGDAWYTPLTNGQGILFTVLPGFKLVFLAWFTFDRQRPAPDVQAILGEPGHRWATAQGSYDDRTAVLTIYSTAGGVFDHPDPAAVTDPEGIGTITLNFADCESGWMHFEIPSRLISGSRPIQRIVPDKTELCEMLSQPPEATR